jgi:hypothetical protein
MQMNETDRRGFLFYVMKIWSKRLLYLTIFFLWLLVMSLPVTMVVLARNGSVQIGNENRTNLRLFMVQEDRENGVGVAITRATREKCLRTSLVYLMWEGEGENSSYCQCLDDQGQILSTDCP